MNWQRVTRQQLCPICHKPDWCMIAPRGDVVLCMRVVSSKPHEIEGGEVGYFHDIKDADVRFCRHNREAKNEQDPVINVGKLMDRWREETEDTMIEQFAEALGLRLFALQHLRCVRAREHCAWAFPMFDGYGNYVGVRLRTTDGSRKWAVRGSHQGVFLPYHHGWNLYGQTRMALVCEGPTDTAAALSIGFYAVGRPSCGGGMADIITAFRRLGVTSAVIVADSDEVGCRGATMLQKHLPIRSALIVLPAKDLREFVRLGGTRELLDSMINNLVWEAR